MSEIPRNKQKHLTQEDRIAIETGLNAGRSMRSIAQDVGKDPSTISKEVKKRRTHQPRSTFNDSGNQCALRRECTRKNVCGSASLHCQKKRCKTCGRCNRLCPDFVQDDFHCTKLDRAPFVCNGCKKKSSCRYDKEYYRAGKAHKEYRAVLIETRKGLNISEEDLNRLDEIVSPLIRQGLSPYMILATHPEIELSEKSLYNYISCGALSVGNLDLPKKVSYKVRKSRQSSANTPDPEAFMGRTYTDYLNYLKDYPDIRVVEMDTVIGCEGSHKVLLTLHFNPCEFMVAYLLDSKEARHVKAVFDQIEDAVGPLLFNQVFQLILTDRGGEFQHPNELECDSEGLIRTCIYYCDPMCSWQKPHCEKNHEYIRKILPKGSSFDALTQKDIDLMMSHINSAVRESLGGHTPLDMAKMILPEIAMDHFNLRSIEPDDVILTPKLLKR